MGTWGFNILDDDFVRDVYDDYMEAFNVKVPADEIMRELLNEHPSDIDDEDDDEGALFWLAVAKAQWDCGHLQPDVVARVRRIVEEGLGLENWEYEGPKVLAKRKAKLAAFLEAIQQPNPKPRKPKPPTRRKPVYDAGTCLAIKLADGDYGAVLVLVADLQEERGPRKETYGQNLVGVLAYKSHEKPTREVFESRRWLQRTHHAWGMDGKGSAAIYYVTQPRFKKVAHQFEIVDRIEIRDDDPSSSATISGWGGIEPDIMYQDAWDRGIRD